GRPRPLLHAHQEQGEHAGKDGDQEIRSRRPQACDLQGNEDQVTPSRGLARIGQEPGTAPSAPAYTEAAGGPAARPNERQAFAPAFLFSRRFSRNSLPHDRLTGENGLYTLPPGLVPTRSIPAR